MEWQGIIMTKYYDSVRLLPRWALYVLTGLIGSLVMNFVHRGTKPQTPTVKSAPVTVAAKQSISGTSTSVAPPGTVATPTKGKGKRGKK